MITSLHKMTKTATPTSFHIFLDSISPRIQRIYTQNIDSLENRFATLASKVPLPPKAPWPKTIQLHGDVHFAVCSKCHWVGPLDPAQLSSPEEMGCKECQVADDVRQVVGKRVLGVGIIRPRVVLYNETNPDAVPCIITVMADNCRTRLELYQMRISDQDHRPICSLSSAQVSKSPVQSESPAKPSMPSTIVPAEKQSG
jgi:NAD-dependent SIR2 family protein deacetylase